MNYCEEAQAVKNMQQEYIDHHGLICPLCKSRQIAATGSPEVDGLNSAQEVECLECGSAWLDVYTFDHVEIKQCYQFGQTS